MAAACRIHLGVEHVNVMLLELVQKTEEVFLTASTLTSSYDNQVTHLLILKRVNIYKMLLGIDFREYPFMIFHHELRIYP